MVNTQSLAGTIYFSEIDVQLRTLEEAFEKLFEWSRHNSIHTVFLREWCNLKFHMLKLTV